MFGVILSLPASAAADRITVTFTSSKGAGFCNLDSFIQKSTALSNRYVQSGVIEGCVGLLNPLQAVRGTYLNETTLVAGDREVARKTSEGAVVGRTPTIAKYTLPVAGALYHSTGDITIYSASKDGFAWTGSTRGANCRIFNGAGYAAIWCFGLTDTLVY